MNSLLVAAAVLAVLVGLIHSALGEILIFRRLPRASNGALPQPHGVLWATWHIASVLGWALAALLWKLAASPAPPPLQQFLLTAIATAFAASALLVLIGTRGRHPGWAGLGGVAVLIWLA